MLLTPTFMGSLLAGMACWLLFWFGVSHLDSTPILNRYLTKDMVLTWIHNNPVSAMLITEVVNIAFHGLGTAGAVFFTFAGTFVNVCVIFGVIPIMKAISQKLSKTAGVIDMKSSKSPEAA
jgi:fatty-acid desaturase